MKCSFKTMMSVGGAMFLAAGLAYFAFEEARAAILASLPFLLVLLCPISMLVMMKFMHSGGQDEHGASCGSPGSKPRKEGMPLEGARNPDALARQTDS